MMRKLGIIGAMKEEVALLQEKLERPAVTRRAGMDFWDGGILPAVGFGLLLRVMFKAQYIPYLIAGFLFVCYIQVSNLLPVAVLGAGFAVYEFFNAKSRQQAQPQPVASKNEEEDYSNGI